MTVSELTVYWQPGCTSCLRLKEYLTGKGVSYRSVNVLADAQGMADLVRLGVRRVPILARGSEWCDGLVLSEINALAGIGKSTELKLTPLTLSVKVRAILNVLSSYVRQIPEQRLAEMLPNRARSFGGLACHVAEIVHYFLQVVEHDHVLVFEDYDHPLPHQYASPDSLVAFSESVATAFERWASQDLPAMDMSQTVDLYYGAQSLHDFLERTTWHAGQHLRQLELVLRMKIGVEPIPALDSRIFEGLPMPKAVWDDHLDF